MVRQFGVMAEPAAEPSAAEGTGPVVAAERIVLYADFTCPWSYLASRRAARLAEAGVVVDWRAVEHDQWRPRRLADETTRFESLRQEMDRVLAELLPEEELPYALAGFVPYSRPAVTAYAEAYGAGVGPRVRRLLFDAFWMHGVDLGDAGTLRPLLVDAIRSGASPSELLHTWGYALDVFGGPITMTGWRLVRDWSEQWQGLGKEVVPVLHVEGAEPTFGVDAVQWLGAELARRGLDPRPPASPAAPPVHRDRDLASLSWVSQHGNRWMRAYQRAHRTPLFPHAG